MFQLRQVLWALLLAAAVVPGQGVHLSAGTPVLGATTSLSVDAPGAAQDPYILALSLSDRPGFSIAGRTIQLAQDDLFFASLSGAPGLQGFQGLLDAQGRALASIAALADPTLVGVDVYAAAAVVSALSGSLSVSNTVRREIKAPAPPLDFSALDQALLPFASRLGTPEGLAVGVVKDGQIVHRVALGGWTTSTRARTGSACKWPVALLLMALVQDGVLSLDDRVSQWLPDFTGSKATITLRQCFSHTSGLPGQALCLNDLSLTLAQCTQQIANGRLLAAPGTEFRYGGVSMQVVGRVMEVATSRPFEALFQERVGIPLGMMTFGFDGFGATLNPRVAGGGMGSLDDYLPILVTALEGGDRLLTTDLILEQHADQTNGVPIVSTPQPNDQRYGLGVWREEIGPRGDIVRLSSPGAFGCYPWIDLARGYGAVVLIDRDLAQGRAIEATIRPILEALFPIEVVR